MAVPLSVELLRLRIAEEVRGRVLLPTITASNRHGGTPEDMRNGTSRDSFLNHHIAKAFRRSANLSPAFCAEMMGFPADYTLLPFLADSADTPDKDKCIETI